MPTAVARGLLRAGLALAVVVSVVPRAEAQQAQPSKPDGKQPSKPDAPQDGKADAALAQKKFETATKKYDKKDYAGALVLYREALAASASPNARLFVARCLVELGKSDEAYNELARTIDDATELTKTEPRYARTRDEAKKELAAVEPKVALVSIALTGAPAQAVRVTINGEVADNTRLERPIAAKPGPIVVEVAADGYARFHRDLNVPAGTTESLSIAMEKEGSGSEQGGGTAGGGGSGGPTTGGAVRTAGFVVAGVGVVGAVTFLIAGSSARARFNRIEEECGGERCKEPRYAGEVDSGKTMTTVANVALVVGIAGILGGGAMIVLGGPKEAGKTGAGQGRYVSVAPTWGGAVATGRF